MRMIWHSLTLGTLLLLGSSIHAQDGEQRAECRSQNGGTTIISLNASQTLASWRSISGRYMEAEGSVRTRRNGSQFFFGTVITASGDMPTMALELDYDGQITSYVYTYALRYGEDREIRGDCEPA